MKNILPKEEHWRIVNYDLRDKGHIIDWTHEREWRVAVDIEFDYKDIEILVSSNTCGLNYAGENAIISLELSDKVAFSR